MSDFLKNFLQQDIRAQGGKAPGRIHVAAFGKHPGWNDHIDNLGLETETLVAADQLIYVEGIASQIGAGAWERLPADSLYPEFDHSLLWHRPGEAIVGIIASSRDGKGRTRYPMVLCAHVVGLPLGRVVREVRPVIEAAMAECRSAETAAAVREIVERTRRQFGSMLARPYADDDALRPSNPEMGDGPSEGQIRLLYEIRSKLSAWAPGHCSAKDAAGRERGEHLRLELAGKTVADSWLYWADFLHSQLDTTVPLLFLSPLNGGWMDVLIGKPAAADFFVLKAGTKAVPLVSEVPYEIGADFRATVRAVFPETVRGAQSECTVFGPRPGRGAKEGLWRQTWQRLLALGSG